MPKFSLNLSLLLTELPLYQRFAAAAELGFKGVEIQFLDDYPARDLAELAAESGLEIVLYNFPAGDISAGDIGIAAIPGREQEFARGVERAVENHDVLKVKRINILAGKIPSDVSRATAMSVLEKNVKVAVDAFAGKDVDILLEPANGVDLPNFLLQKPRMRLRLSIASAVIMLRFNWIFIIGRSCRVI